MPGALWNRFRYSVYAPFYDLVLGRSGVVSRGRERASPSIARRAANLFTGLAATEIDRQLGPLPDAAGLAERIREDAGRSGFLVVARADRR